MTLEHKTALCELDQVLSGIDADSVDEACRLIADANQLLLYGCGREGLQIRGLAMRLYHLGLNATMVADMAAPPLRKGDVFITSAGPGELSTVNALMQIAAREQAHILLFTAVPDTPAAANASHVVAIPAQTMANDQISHQQSLLPMGSIYEGALFMLFEMMILELQKSLSIDTSAMRARHTNME